MTDVNALQTELDRAKKVAAEALAKAQAAQAALEDAKNPGLGRARRELAEVQKERNSLNARISLRQKGLRGLEAAYQKERAEKERMLAEIEADAESLDARIANLTAEIEALEAKQSEAPAAEVEEPAEAPEGWAEVEGGVEEPAAEVAQD